MSTFTEKSFCSPAFVEIQATAHHDMLGRRTHWPLGYHHITPSARSRSEGSEGSEGSEHATAISSAETKQIIVKINIAH
jgi:hypothetical protein